MSLHLKIKPQQTILNATELQGLSLEANCKNGYCGNCRCKLKKGKVEYTEKPLAMLNDGDILPCVATAVSSEIAIETTAGEMIFLNF